MNVKELREYLESKLDMEKFESAVIRQIEMANKEITDVKDQIRESSYKSHINMMWNRIVDNTHLKVSGQLTKKTISKNEEWVKKIEELNIIESLNESFGDM